MKISNHYPKYSTNKIRIYVGYKRKINFHHKNGVINYQYVTGVFYIVGLQISLVGIEKLDRKKHIIIIQNIYQ